MGMSDNMLACIRAIAENRIQDAKQYAIYCCVEDSTKKNEGKVQYYKKLLENGSDNVMEVPMNIKGLVKMIDVSDFNESRYYLGKQQAVSHNQRVYRPCQGLIRQHCPQLNTRQTL